MLCSLVERKCCRIKPTDYNQDTFCKTVFMEMCFGDPIASPELNLYTVPQVLITESLDFLS